MKQGENLETQEVITANAQMASNQSVGPEEEQSGITFSEIWHMIVKRWKGLVLFVVASLAVGLVYNFAFKKPQWRSSGSTIVLVNSGSSASDSSEITTTNLNISITLLPSLVTFINDEPVMTKATAKLNTLTNDDGSLKYGKYKIDDVKKLVSASARKYTSLEKSLYIDIVATTSDKVLSTDLVTVVLEESIALANDTSLQYSRVFKDTMFLSSEASTPTNAAMAGWKVELIAGAIGLVLGIIYAIVFSLLDTRIISEKDLERITGLKNIGVIPGKEETAEQKNKRAEMKGKVK